MEEIVFIIADEQHHELYQGFSFKNKKVEIYNLVNALDILKDRPANIILLDCNIDFTTGLKLLKEIKALCPNIPVIFISDTGLEDIVLRAFRGGARDFFRKPVNIPELQDTVEGLLRIKYTSKERRSPFTKKRNIDSEGLVGTPVNESHNFIHAIQYIVENLSEAISLERLAKETAISKYHFCRLFKKSIGMSPKRFVNFMRIERAKEFFRKNGLSVTTVATEVGFNDLSNFVTQFKKFTGMTPTAYRKSIKT